MIKFLFAGGGTVKSPLQRNVRLQLDGPEMFWCITFATGVLAMSAEAGVNLSAIRLFTVEILCLAGLTLCQNKPILSIPLKLYIIFLLWLAIGCFYAPSLNFSIRTIFKYIYPFILCLFASAAVGDGAVFIKSSSFARIIALVSLISIYIPIAGYIFSGTFAYGTARVINYISMMIFSLGLFYFAEEKKKNLIYTIIFLLPCFIAVFRTSILGSGVALMAFFLIKYRIKALPIIFAIIIGGVIAVFTIPSLKEKMFYAEVQDQATIENFQEGKITSDIVNTNYRDYMWKKLKKELYNEHKTIGSGTGATQHELYSNIGTGKYSNLNATHGDFIQIQCDNGLVGLWLYCIMIGAVFCHCFAVYWKPGAPKMLRLAAIVAGASLLGTFATMYSDNTVNYSMATLGMPFGFYGMMLGLKQRYYGN